MKSLLRVLSGKSMLVLLLFGCGGGGDAAVDAGASAALQLASPGTTVAVAPSAEPVVVAATAPAAATTTAQTSTSALTPSRPVQWQRLGTVAGLCCFYTPFVVQGAQISAFSNARNTNDDGQLFRYDGSLSGVGPASLVLTTDEITDVPASSFKVRTLGVRRDATAGWFAILRVGRGYPTSDGYVPALATSPDGRRWTYQGKLRVEGRLLSGFSDANNLVLQMDQPAVLDTQRPFQNRFLIFETNLSPDGIQRKLVALYSADGVDWRFHRDLGGQVVDLWPTDAALASDQPVFPTAEVVNGDIHVLVGDRWRESSAPIRAHRHLCAPKGASALKYLGDSQTWRSGDKGPNVAYDAGKDTLYAISNAVAYALPSASTACR